MRRSFKRAFSARRPARPSRVWVDVAGQFALSGVSSTTAVVLVQLQAPSDLSNLTADPPEDLTVLRMRGSFACSMGGPANWTLALLVQDTMWSPSAVFSADADKRVLWCRTFSTTAAVTHRWEPPGYMTWDPAGTPQVVSQPGVTELDISPKVKVEAGKALYLVAYENGGASSMTVVSTEMRLLFQRSGRR